jgi:hypothetical protein
MRALTQLLYGLSRIALLALAVAFFSFWLLTLDGFDAVKPVAEYATKYIPILLLPVSAAMILVLLVRWAAVNKHEKVSFGDFLAFVVAVALQVATIIVYRAQGNEIAGPFAANIPDVNKLTDAAAPYGMLSVAVLQLGAFIFYWIADPDPKTGDAD